MERHPHHHHLTKAEEREIISETAMQYARLELEKVAQYITDLLQLGDEGVVERMDLLDGKLDVAKRWIQVHQDYISTLPTQVAHPIPDHEDDDKEGERL
jgi:hypothetical protein